MFDRSANNPMGPKWAKHFRENRQYSKIHLIHRKGAENAKVNYIEKSALLFFAVFPVRRYFGRIKGKG